MKHIVTIFFSFTFIVNISAQLKKVEFGSSTIVDETTIDIPNFKKINSKKSTQRAVFTPKSLKYMASDKNGLKVLTRGNDQLPIFIKGEPEQEYRNTNTPNGKAINFLENAKDLMSINNPSDEFELVKVDTDELGMTHVKYQQIYKGIPVYGSEVIFHYDSKNQFLNGRYKTTPKIESVEPGLDKTKVFDLVEKEIGGTKGVANDKFDLFDMESITGDLVIYNDILCYQVTVYKSIIDRWQYMVNAQTGAIEHKYRNMCMFHNHDHSHSGTCNHNKEAKKLSSTIDSKVTKLTSAPPPDGPTISSSQDLFGATRLINTYESGGQFYLIDAARTMYDNFNSSIPNDPVGTIWTIDAFNTSPQNDNFQYDHVISNSSSFSGKQTGVSAQYNGGKAYEYFKTVHQRESINGSGGNVIGLINIADEDGSSLGNAFWNGIAMFYGNGDNSFQSLARGLDVAGHEMSHGVVQSTANLEYQGESGALNESFADIFGAMIDRDDWLIGEDVVKTSAFPSGALRSLQDPHNGASTGNFNAGWQPRTYSERFTGSQDNGGVHINSGIPNWAFYRFATTSGVGKEVAEKVYYRALNTYLTKSSQFIDARIAVVQSATDLYGSNVANAARAAFDAVEVFNGDGTVVTTDVETNPGEDLILFTTEDQEGLFIATAAGELLANPLTEQDPLSVPSITDDGTEIIFVNQDKELYYILLDWDSGSLQVVNEGVITSNNIWRNVIFSKDGLRMAALRDAQENKVFVYDFITETGEDYTLFNPTFTEGISTGDVLFADALKFDFAGDNLMYDAFNSLESSFGNPIEYWDIGFIEVFDSGSGNFALGTDSDLLQNPNNTPNIEKLFSQLPEGISIGNPTFSKNSDYVIAFDFLEDGEFRVLGSNIEAQETQSIFDNNDRPGYPSYSNDDDRVLFDAINDDTGLGVLGAAILFDNKIESNSAGIQLGFNSAGIKWGVWFGNGERDITSTEDLILAEDAISLFPNPAGESITILSTIDTEGLVQITIHDIMGRTVKKSTLDRLNKEININISDLNSGQFIMTVRTEQGMTSKMFVKQ